MTVSLIRKMLCRISTFGGPVGPVCGLKLPRWKLYWYDAANASIFVSW